jgi:hypothetical protein
MEAGVPDGLACEDLRLELLLVEALQREAERLAALPPPGG